jgi:hypothetical protein
MERRLEKMVKKKEGAEFRKVDIKRKTWQVVVDFSLEQPKI